MDHFKPLIGLCGYAQSGKDTVANILIEEFGYRRVAFADELKTMALSINPMVQIKHCSQDKAQSPTVERIWPLRDVVKAEGWEGAKQHTDVRVFLQNLGKTMRDQVSEDFWIQRMLAKNDLDMLTLHTTGVVVTDVRHLNEIAWVTDPLGTGVIWHIHRPNVGPANGHVSEVEWTATPPEVIINNSGSLYDLRQLVIHEFERYLFRSIN